MSAESSPNTDERLTQLNARIQEAVARLAGQLDDVEWRRLFDGVVEMRKQQSQMMEAKFEQLKRSGTRQPEP